jgi:serine/threonine protein kinase
MAKDRKTFKTAFDTYTELEQIGEGGSGRVFKVTDASSHVYAIKTLDPKKAKGDSLKRFKNELFFCLRNKHENILQVFDYGIIHTDEGEIPFYVMCYYSKTLRQLMDGKLSGDTILHYFSQILNGVEVAHLQGIWHRDLKPENILIEPAQSRLVVADFGIAHFTEDEIYTLVGTKQIDRMANFNYASPEQKRKGDAVDKRADIFALGLILNEMYTGVVLQGHGHREIKDIAPEYSYLDEIVDKMVQQDREKRLVSIDKVKELIQIYQNEIITRQKLDALNNEVVPAGKITDVIYNSPMKIVYPNYKDGMLEIKLNHKVNPKWEQAFQSVRPHNSTNSVSPVRFQFRDDTASIYIQPNEAEYAWKYFEQYLQTTAIVYRQNLELDLQKKEEEEKKTFEIKRQGLQAQIRLQEEWKKRNT